MKIFSFNSKKGWVVLVAAVLLLSLSACGEGEAPPVNGSTDAPGGAAQSDGPSTPQASQNSTEGGKTEAGFPVSYTIKPPSHSLRVGKLTCTFHGVRLTDTVSGLDNPEGFRNDASIYCGGESLRYPDFIAEDGEHFVPGVYLLLVDVTVKSQDAESFTRRDLNDLGQSRGEFDDPYLFRSDDLVCLVDLGPKLASVGLPGSGGNDMDYYSGMNRRGEHPVVFRLEPGESIDLTIGFLVSDVEQGGDNELDWLYLAEGAVHEPKDALLHLDLSGEEVLQG